MDDTKTALLGMVFSPPSNGKPIGHASLVLCEDGGAGDASYTQYDYDGYSLVSAQGRDVPRPQGAMVLRSIPAKGAQAVRSYFSHLANPATFRQSNPFYFSIDLAPDPQFEARGRKPANCLSALFDIMRMNNIAHDAGLEGAALAARCNPEAVRGRLLAIAAQGRAGIDTDCYVEEAGNGNWAGFVPDRDGRPMVVITGLDGGLHFDEIMRADVLVGVSGYRTGTVADLARGRSALLEPVVRGGHSVFAAA